MRESRKWVDDPNCRGNIIVTHYMHYNLTGGEYKHLQLQHHWRGI